MNEVINELSDLYRDIAICQTDILNARLHKNHLAEDFIDTYTMEIYD